jgi:MarR family transcriptional regulator, transcriptional regulator for hemolysin
MDRAEALRANRAANKLSKAYRALNARRLASLGLHPGQDVLLWVLAESENGMTVSQLAQALGVEPPTATRSLARMDELGLFRRVPVPGDRRQVRIVVNDDGRKLIPQIERVWVELAETAFGGLPARARAAGIDALERANERLREHVEESVYAED